MDSKTRPGLFNDITVDTVAKNVAQAHTPEDDKEEKM